MFIDNKYVKIGLLLTKIIYEKLWKNYERKMMKIKYVEMKFVF